MRGRVREAMNGAIDNSDILRLVEKARSEIGISEYEMCRRAGIGQGSFSNLKKNRRRLQANMARKLANALEISTIRFFEVADILPKSN
jgi:transcriptional regulator with XRE-family HTH domain